MATESPEPHDAEAAWHALLHDLRGCLGGLKATLDLGEREAGLGARDAARMALGVKEGLVLVELARMLRFGPWPDGGCEPAGAWGKALEAELTALAAGFRGKASLSIAGTEASWPGPLLRSFTLSLARLLMPQALPDALAVEAEAEEEAWILRFRPSLAAPLALQPEGAPKDLHGLWVRAVAGRFGMRVSHDGDTLRVQIPRGSEGLQPVE